MSFFRVSCGYLQHLVFYALGDQSPRPPGIYRFGGEGSALKRQRGRPLWANRPLLPGHRRGARVGSHRSPILLSGKAIAAQAALARKAKNPGGLGAKPPSSPCRDGGGHTARDDRLQPVGATHRKPRSGGNEELHRQDFFRRRQEGMRDRAITNAGGEEERPLRGKPLCETKPICVRRARIKIGKGMGGRGMGKEGDPGGAGFCETKPIPAHPTEGYSTVLCRGARRAAAPLTSLLFRRRPAAAAAALPPARPERRQSAARGPEDRPTGWGGRLGERAKTLAVYRCVQKESTVLQR